MQADTPEMRTHDALPFLYLFSVIGFRTRDCRCRSLDVAGGARSVLFIIHPLSVSLSLCIWQ